MCDELPESLQHAKRATDGSAAHRLFYTLGLIAQTVLWFLAFCGILVALSAGGDITEFRYVGF